VAFTALNDLWVMPLGGEPVRLTDDAYIEWIPSWAPDGRTLWFNSDRHGNGLPEMYSIDLETGEITRRTNLPQARIVFPALSPGGDRVAYIDGSDQSLRVLDVADGASRLVAEQAYASNVGRPSWSPDGRYIVLADIQPFSRRFREGRNLIRVVEVATGEATFHEPGPLPAQLSERFEAGPAWSPDFASGWWATQLAYGITTVLSNGTSTYHTLLARESIDAGRWIGPRLLAAPIYDGTRTYYGHHRSVSSHDVLDLELAAARALEMDYLKSYVRSPADVMARVGEAAAEMGVSSGSHFLSPGIQAGLGGTTHLSATQRMGYSWAQSAGGRSYQDVIALYTEGDFSLSSHHVRTNQILGEEPGLMEDPRVQVLMPRGYLPQLEQQASRPPTDAERQATRDDVATPAAILRGGGLVALGSDSPLAWPALGLHAQLRAFATGVTPHEALQSVTINAARYTRLDHELGTLEPGKIADLVLVRGNPLEDVANAARVELVVKSGVPWTQEEIRRLWQ
jgi:hypothetical protein